MIVTQQLYRVILIFFGVALLLFGLWDLLVPRARFVSSNPQPGAVIVDAPSFVTVSFTNKLNSQSRIDVTSTIELLPSGEQDFLRGGSVMVKSEIDPADPSGRSLRAHLQPGLHKGLYWVNWTTQAAGWRTVSYGKTAFGAGMNVPEHLTKDMNGIVWERNYQYRSRRAALVGGLILVVLALFLGAMKPSPSR
jgi:hypothetical protein